MAQQYAGAVIGALGGGVSSALSARAAKSARAWSKRRYAERYQVTMKDMRKAGLNPILAAGMGLGGGGTPSGAAASMPNLAGIGDSVTRGAEQEQKGGLIKSQREQIAALLDEIVQRTATSAAQEAKLTEETRLLGVQANLVDSTNRNIVEPILEWLEKNYGTTNAKEGAAKLLDPGRGVLRRGPIPSDFNIKARKQQKLNKEREILKTRRKWRSAAPGSKK